MSVTRCLLYSAPLVFLALVAAWIAHSATFVAHLTDPNLQVVFPYLAQLFVKYPLLVGLALLAPLLAGHRFTADSMARFRHGNEYTKMLVRVLALFFVLNLFAFGVFGRWYEDRYIVHTYPFMLALGAYTLVVGLDILLAKMDHKKPALVIAAGVVALCVLMPHHMIQGAWRAAAREHGDTNIENSRYFPDHASVGEYVRANLQPGDKVVATDVLQQRWYIGQADFWLRNESDVSIYVYKDQEGKIRDIYVNAEYLDAHHANELLTGNDRVWVVVSSIDVAENWAFSAAEREFLDAVKTRGKLALQGRDGRSAVYVFGGDA